MFQPRSRVRGLLLLALLLFGGLLLALLARPAAWTVDAGAPGDRLFLRGFFAPETSVAPETSGTAEGTRFRWSGSESRLLLHGAGAAPLTLRMRLNGDHLAQQADPRLFIRRDGRTLAAVAVTPGWRVYQVVLPAGATQGPPGGTVPLEFAVADYCPLARDNRVLGVPLDWLHIEAAVLPPGATGAGALLAPLRWTLLLLWGLVLAGGAAGLRWPRQRGRIVVLLALVAGGLLLAAWLARPVLLALLAWAPPLLALATLALLAGWRWHVLVGWWRSLPAGALPLAGVVVVLVAHLLLVLPLPLAWRGGAAWLVLLLPGALLGWLLFARAAPDDERDPLLVLVLALCGGLALLALLLLALHALPGALPWWALLLACDALSLGLALLLWRAGRAQGARPAAPERRRESLPRGAAAGLVLVLLLAAGLRLVHLGGAEFAGDEARAMLLAMGVQHGQDGILLLHRKGPVEVLLPAAPLVLLGQINEWAARLPFALAGIGAVLGVFVLARRMLGGRLGALAGLVAASVVALDGFLIAFSRIVQYQSVLVLLAVGVLLCGWRFYAGTAHPRRALLAAAALAAVGLLAHYDGIYVLPALAGLVLAGGLRHWHGARAWLRGLGPPLLLGALLLAAFYLPFVLHEQFQGTLRYLATRVGEGGSGLFANNLPAYYARASFYNSTFQVHWLALLLGAAVPVWLLRLLRPRGAGLLLAGLWLASGALLLLAPDRFDWGGVNLALLAFGLPLAGLLLLPGGGAPLRLLVGWLLLPFVAHAFVIDDPRTHFYTLHPAAALLAGLALAQLWHWLAGRGWRVARGLLLVGSGAVVLLALPYLYLLYIQQMPEYYRSFPAARPALYRASYGDTVPAGGHFGFAHRDGWKVIGELYRNGVLAGVYDTNQRSRISTWYTRGALPCVPDPQVYLLATWEGAALADRLHASEDPQDYALTACVLVDGRRMLDVYERRAPDRDNAGEPPPTPQPYRLEEYARRFDAQPVPHFPLQNTLDENVPQYAYQARWPHGIALVGYDLEQRRIAAGQSAFLTLYWQVDAPLPREYELVVELWRAADPADDARGAIMVKSVTPLCNPTTPARWSPYYLNGTSFAVRPAEELPAGRYTLRVGLRNPATGALLPVAGVSGGTAGAADDGTGAASVLLTTIDVTAAQGE
jgi:4-amino-4-deoxy-L-arabinose transferase-like glycosyltransferase